MNYPENYQRLQNLIASLGSQLPGPMREFEKLHHSTQAEGALSTKFKELMALSISICVRCGGCVTYHVHDALAAGATRQEILEAIAVSVTMGGGPAVVYGCEALEALDQFQAESENSSKKQIGNSPLIPQ